MNSISIARLAQSVERQALNLVVGGSSPPVGAFLFILLFFFFCILWFLIRFETKQANRNKKRLIGRLIRQYNINNLLIFLITIRATVIAFKAFLMNQMSTGN